MKLVLNKIRVYVTCWSQPKPRGNNCRQPCNTCKKK